MSAQFRLIQKRLISKFKVKNPTPLSNLELLLEDTYNEILFVTEQFEEERMELVKCQNDLSCALHVLVNVIKLMDGNNNVASLIEATFSPIVYDLDNQVLYMSHFSHTNYSKIKLFMLKLLFYLQKINKN